MSGEPVGLYQEVEDAMVRAMEGDEYWNPHFLYAVIEGLEDCGHPVGDDIREWAKTMWSR